MVHDETIGAVEGHQPSAGSSTNSALRQIDAAEAGKFLALLDPDAEVFLFASGDDDKERRKRSAQNSKTSRGDVSWQHRRCTLPQARHWLQKRQQNGWGAFVAVQAMKGKSARKSDVDYIRAVYADLDMPEPRQPWPIAPSATVETSPGRYQVYWLVDPEEPIDSDDFTAIMKVVVDVYGSDANAKDIARRLRLPGTWNQKPSRPPHLVRIVQETGARYSRRELLTAFPPPPPRSASKSAPGVSSSCAKSTSALMRLAGPNDDGPLFAISPDEYNPWICVGMALHAVAGGSHEGLLLWERWSSRSAKWEKGACDQKWSSFGREKGVSAGTILHMAKERGWKPLSRSPARLTHTPNDSTADDANDPDALKNLEFDTDICVETAVNALVKGVLHPGDLAVLYGPPAAGKTFAAIDLAYHIAHGKPYAGRRVRRAPVLYVGLEGQRGLRHRILACRDLFDSAGKMFARLTLHTPLGRDTGKGGEREIVRHAQRLAKEAGQEVGLIVVDTLARAIAPDDENTAKDMSAFINRCSSIASATGAAILIVHHPGKDEGRGMRGSSVLLGACDATLRLAVNGGVRTLEAEKIKEASSGRLLNFRLRPVVLGTDDDGDEITTCVVEVTNEDIPSRALLAGSQAANALAEL